MIATLFATGQLNAPLGFAAALAVGFCFGLCLEKAGFGSSRRLTGVFYLTDMTVVKVMFTAMVTAALGLVAASRLGVLAPETLYLMPTVLGAHAAGGVILGLGFAMGGWCPGTAAVGLASGRLDALVFLVGVVLGSVGFAEAFPWVAPYASMGSRGVSFLFEALDITQDQLVLALTGGAVALFWVCEVIERGPAIARPGVSRLFLAGFSVLLCLAALVALNVPRVQTASGPAAVPAIPGTAPRTGAQTGQPQPAQPSPDAAILAQVQSGGDHMEPWELARRIMAQDPSLALVDIRTPEEFAAFHLKGAANIPMAELPQALAAKRGQGVVVLYSNGMTHPAQARDALARLGFPNVYLLTGGLKGFFEEVLKPVSLRDAAPSPEEAQRIREARKFFLPADWNAPANPALLAPPARLPGVADVQWLAANLGKPGLKVIDLRPQPQYNAGHVPGSLSLHLESLRGNQEGVPSMLLPAPLLAAHMGQMGLTPRDLVAILPGDSPHDATLLAMALERLGHRRTVVVLGGWKAWAAANLPKDAALPKVTPSRYPAPEGPDGFTVNGRETHAAMTGGRTVILDVRPADYFSGAKSDEARPGHIPGAVNRPFTEDQAKGPGEIIVFKPSEELEKAYAALIPSKDHPVIVHCRTGHQASQTWWVLTRLLGYTNVRWYDAGWTEWAARPEWPAVAAPPPAQPAPQPAPQTDPAKAAKP
ncbi:Putative thiosulfate sulfurtransferase [Fundidesulfovibrio magnetotacticus]|uniref:Thiosulfate sulfurtransferase n=1 Tax=Fundidesulfovibrio magnetotacticus TaxID=2730080 RepID=A0A6V8LWS1_9BACT|nr:rhodanese-like domain-containing protein [Fundidesulfovibrio magnetotacticus]GFK94718.1 Putative thiosulfate sulfurtransferase [Fundidesulfovibrio magnetotacticus]